MEEFIREIISLLNEGSRKGSCILHPDGLSWILYNDESLQNRILEKVITSPITKYLYYDDDPNRDKRLGGYWKLSGYQTWEIPPKIDLRKFRSFLICGNWTIYFADRPSNIRMISYREYKTTTLEERMMCRGIRLLIDSGPDDEEWHISISPDLQKNQIENASSSY